MFIDNGDGLKARSQKVMIDILVSTGDQKLENDLKWCRGHGENLRQARLHEVATKVGQRSSSKKWHPKPSRESGLRRGGATRAG